MGGGPAAWGLAFKRTDMKAVATPITAMADRMLIQDGRRKLYLNRRSGARSFGCISSSQTLKVTLGTAVPDTISLGTEAERTSTSAARG